MTTFYININEKTKLGKAILDLLLSTASESKAISIIEEKSPYNPEFVKMVLESAREKGGIEVDPSNVWESIK
ncbi:MAG: hypothetical protein HYU67_07940 [Flavobacteriia bacterium]|nr:hypothetical protein [Flavobacteriia bacterium]